MNCSTLLSSGCNLPAPGTIWVCFTGTRHNTSSQHFIFVANTVPVMRRIEAKRFGQSSHFKSGGDSDNVMHVWCGSEAWPGDFNCHIMCVD